MLVHVRFSSCVMNCCLFKKCAVNFVMAPTTYDFDMFCYSVSWFDSVSVMIVARALYLLIFLSRHSVQLFVKNINKYVLV